MISDVELLERAIAASGRPSARRFAMEVLGVDERTNRYWLDGRKLPASVRIICFAVILRPSIADELAEANARIIAGEPP